MYAGRVACCPLVSHVVYAPRALLRLEKDETDGWTNRQTDRQTDGRHTLTASRAVELGFKKLDF